MSHLLGMLIILTWILSGCSDTFYPTVDSSQQILVVDGMITNADTTYTINLSLATPYNSSNSATPVSNAIVTVSDNQSNTFSFTEVSPGVYNSLHGSFLGTIGRTYTLNITTTDGSVYQSTSQYMEQPLPIDSMYGIVLNKQFLVDDGLGDGGTISVYEQGIESYLNIGQATGNTSNFRFISNLVIETTAEGSVPRNPLTFPYYYWYTESLDNTINIAANNSSIGKLDVTDHDLSFFAMDVSRYYYIADTQSLVNYVLSIQEVAINSDTYNYYGLINQQLSAGNQLFDPIVTQVQGNIYCKSNSTKKALGFFQASAIDTFTYVVYPNLSIGPVLYNRAKNFGNYPLSGYVIDMPPSFWR